MVFDSFAGELLMIEETGGRLNPVPILSARHSNDMGSCSKPLYCLLRSSGMSIGTRFR